MTPGVRGHPPGNKTGKPERAFVQHEGSDAAPTLRRSCHGPSWASIFSHGPRRGVSTLEVLMRPLASEQPGVPR